MPQLLYQCKEITTLVQALRNVQSGCDLRPPDSSRARLDGPRSLNEAPTIWPPVESALASQIREVDALFRSAEMATRFSAFHLADVAAELATLAFAAAQL